MIKLLWWGNSESGAELVIQLICRARLESCSPWCSQHFEKVSGFNHASSGSHVCLDWNGGCFCCRTGTCFRVMAELWWEERSLKLSWYRFLVRCDRNARYLLQDTMKHYAFTFHNEILSMYLITVPSNLMEWLVWSSWLAWSATGLGADILLIFSKAQHIGLEEVFILWWINEWHMWWITVLRYSNYA